METGVRSGSGQARITVVSAAVNPNAGKPKPAITTTWST
jgi:hypothetical protein